MSQLKYLHSHSGLERYKNFPKNIVLVDECYGELFSEKKPFEYDRRRYFCVNIYEFYKRGGVFKNLLE